MYKALIYLLNTIFSIAYPQVDEATLLFAGDAMMHKAQLEAAKDSKGEYNFDECFSDLAPFISNADYAVVNLETPLAGAPYSGYPCFCAPDSYADALKAAGFDFFLTANNHALDKSDRGVRRTINVLKSKNIPYIGTYRNTAQRDSLLPVIKDVKGFKIGFLNYTYGTNGIVARDGVVVDYIDKQKIKSDLKRVRDAGAELVCVCMHWGYEYKLLPNAEQKALADFLVDEGVELVIGGHPHVIQPMEMHQRKDGRNSLVVYSLGNFISAMKLADTRGGAMVKAFISRDKDGKAQVDSAGYKLVFVETGVPGVRNFKVVDADSCSQSQAQSLSKTFRKNATDIFTRHNLNVPPLGK